MASHRLAAIALAVFVLASGAAVAVEPDERLADPALEARARAISSNSAASSARTSLSTTAARRSPVTCGCWSATASRPAVPTPM